MRLWGLFLHLCCFVDRLIDWLVLYRSALGSIDGLCSINRLIDRLVLCALSMACALSIGLCFIDRLVLCALSIGLCFIDRLVFVLYRSACALCFIDRLVLYRLACTCQALIGVIDRWLVVACYRWLVIDRDGWQWPQSSICRICTCFCVGR